MPLLPNSHKKGIAINKGNNSWRHDAILAILKFEDIMVLNNVTKIADFVSTEDFS